MPKLLKLTGIQTFSGKISASSKALAPVIHKGQTVRVSDEIAERLLKKHRLVGEENAVVNFFTEVTESDTALDLTAEAAPKTKYPEEVSAVIKTAEKTQEAASEKPDDQFEDAEVKVTQPDVVEVVKAAPAEVKTAPAAKKAAAKTTQRVARKR